MTDENPEQDIEVPEDSTNDDLKETLKKRLELELGLPLTPKTMKQVDLKFRGNVILLDNFPINGIVSIKIDSEEISSDDYLLIENEGTIYLNKTCSGKLFIEYTYCLPEDEYSALLDLMVDYELDTGWNKNASSIKENNVTVNYDTSLGKGALIQGMINDLRNKYACVVEMI